MYRTSCNYGAMSTYFSRFVCFASIWFDRNFPLPFRWCILKQKSSNGWKWIKENWNFYAFSNWFVFKSYSKLKLKLKSFHSALNEMWIFRVKLQIKCQQMNIPLFDICQNLKNCMTYLKYYQAITWINCKKTKFSHQRRNNGQSFVWPFMTSCHID